MHSNLQKKIFRHTYVNHPTVYVDNRGDSLGKTHQTTLAVIAFIPLLSRLTEKMPNVMYKNQCKKP